MKISFTMAKKNEIIWGKFNQKCSMLIQWKLQHVAERDWTINWDNLHGSKDLILLGEQFSPIQLTKSCRKSQPTCLPSWKVTSKMYTGIQSTYKSEKNMKDEHNWETYTW